MSHATPVREAPAGLPVPPPAADPAFPNVSAAEEVLDLNTIQGNIIDGGFNKDFQTVLCLEIVDVARFKPWLKAQLPFIATAADVLTFNRLFKKLHQQRGEPTGLKATWVNIAFSFAGLTRLTHDADAFIDASFKAGLAARSPDLGDPPNPAAEGNAQHWVIGGPQDHDRLHVIMLIASDDRADMLAEVARIEESIFNFRTAAGHHAPSGTRIIFREEGANLPAPLGGHEHFGTQDGVSQPGVRGRISAAATDVLTPRQNPHDRNQGKPGQDLLWPGEFVFGYAAQNPNAARLEDSKGERKKAVTGDPHAPHWTDNGSFLVFRRLRQDVFKFHRFLHDQAERLAIDPLLVSAKLVGRWESGAPTVRNPDRDTPAMGHDDCANNDFEFNKGAEGPPAPGPRSAIDCVDHFPGAPKDDAADPGSNAATGKRCPFDAHTRKAYPRNDLTPAGTIDRSEVTTQTHRLMRRGIPFGPVSPSTPTAPRQDDGDRGLHFLAYQTSIVNQFEFVTRAWVNNPNFSREAATGHECQVGGAARLPIGPDPLIGQSTQPDGTRTRTFFIRFNDAHGHDQCVPLEAAEEWVIPTGGGYFFTPSLAALETTLTEARSPGAD